MKILFVSEYFPPKIMGGGEINLHLIAKTLAKNLDVHVITSCHEGLKKYERMDNVKIHRNLSTAKNVKSIKDNFKRSINYPKSIIVETKKLVINIKPDIIHFIGTSIIAAKELSKLNIPLISTIESYPTLCPKGDRIFQGKKECKYVCSFQKFVSCQAKSREIGKMKNKSYLKYNPLFHGYIYNYYSNLRNSLEYCNLIAISDYVSKVLLQHGFKSKVIPNMLEVEKFNLKSKKNEKPVILYLGSLIESKGPQILLNAIDGLNCKIKIYGEGILKNKLKKIIKEKKIDAEICQQVSYEKIPEIYANSDIIVFPSIWPEPFGRIAIESTAAGKPVIGSAIGAIKKTITSKTGVLVQPNNVEDLREKILFLMNNKFRVDTKVAQMYSSENIAKKLINEYKMIVEKKNKNDNKNYC